MKLTIIPSDGAVYHNGISVNRLPLTGIPENVHALQWRESSGWIEFNDVSANVSISEIPDWALSAVQAKTDYEIAQATAIAAFQASEAATLAAYDKALTDHLDATAQARRWENRITLMSRAGFPGPWQQDAIAYGTWVDICNAMGYQMVEDYQAGLIPLPTIEEVIAALPEMAWPE